MARKDKFIVGLDIGSTKVCTLIAAVRENGLEPVGFGVAESRGIRRGSIVSLERATESVRKSVSEAETMAGSEVEYVYAGISGCHVKSSNSRGVLTIASRAREITPEDVKKAIEAARSVPLAPDQEIVHVIPQEFAVDDLTGIGDPIGMIGSRLEVNVHIVTSSRAAAQTVVMAVNRSGLLVEDTVLDPIAGATAVLSDDDKELGAVHVDIGGGKTSVAVYHRGAVRHTVVLPVGGEHFSNDIAVGLQTSIPEAERLKREQGCAKASMAEEENVFEIAGVGARQQRVIAQKTLSDILQPRAEEIIHFVRNEIRSAGYERQVGAGMVVTGGTAMLKGFVDLAEEILDVPVRIGISSGLFPTKTSHVSALQGPEFAAVSGLVLYGERRRKRQDFQKSSSGGIRGLFARLKMLI
jgi:cell division protein FtsA